MCLQIYNIKYDKSSQRRNKKRLYNFICVCIERSEYKMKLNDWDIILMNHQMSLDRCAGCLLFLLEMILLGA